MYYAGTVCDGGPGTIFHGNVNIDIGTPLNQYSKPNDSKRGGNQCQADVGGSLVPSQGMAAYSAHAMLASLNIEDTPFRYTPPLGLPINFTVTYNQRENQQPSTFTYSNLGPKWTFNWLSYVTDTPNDSTTNASVYVPGGGAETYVFNPDLPGYPPDPQSHAVLVRISNTRYEKSFPDGSKQVFTQSDGSGSYPRKIFMTQWLDPAGNATLLTYETIQPTGYPTCFRLTAITDALGNVTALSYEQSNEPLKITKVREPFQAGRFAQFMYNPSGQLATITDEIGIQSIFTYTTDGTNFINSLQTPYGTSQFSTGEQCTLQNGQGSCQRWIEMTDPLVGKERVEYDDNTNAIPDSEPANTVPGNNFRNSGLASANTFYWDKKYTSQHNTYDYTLARLIHWAKNSDESSSGIKASKKAPQPLENRVWYAYAGQTDTNHTGTSGSPSQIARVLEDSTTQSWFYDYNTLGKVKKATDPKSRVTCYKYDTNNIDLLAIYQERPGGHTTDTCGMPGAPADLIASYAYNSLHEPLTATDAAQEPTTYTYRPDGHGQLASIQNARGETTTYAYGPMTGVPAGYLASITSPPFNGHQAVTSFTYDPENRVQTVTNTPDNYTVTTNYDNLDRPIQITYSDLPATTQQFKYTIYVNGQDTGVKILDLTASKDRLNRWTIREYDGNRRLTKITDPLNRVIQYGWCNCGSLTSITDANQHVTTFHRDDLLSRVTSKTFDGGIEPIQYTYEQTTSRLKSITDAQGQVTNYSYFVDNDLQAVSYTGVINTTPNVSYTYDPYHNRLTAMSDGIGPTQYSYYEVIGTPSPGAGQLYQVVGPFTNDTITYTYDQLGRVVGESISDGFASTTPYDSLGRLDSSTNSLGPFTRIYDSVTPRLLTLTDVSNGQTSNYVYWDNSHDRRLRTLHSTTIGQVNLSQHDYTYDPEGQILTWTKTLGTQQSAPLTFSYDNAQQLTGVSYLPQQDLRKEYDYDNAGNRLTDLFFISGPHNQGGNTYTANNLNQLNTVVIDPGNGNATGPFSLTYDGNGNLMSDGSLNRTYGWDAANRLVAITYNNGSTAFAYDGLGRRVMIAEYGPATMATVQPKNGSYTAYKTASFTLPTGAYEITFTGVNPNAGNNTAFIDQVALNGTLVANGGFEAPQVNDYAVAPTQSSWTYTGNAGIADNGGTFIGTNAAPPQGNQAAFITNNGSITQIGSVAPGTYSLSFKVAQRANNNQSYQQIQVSVRGASSTKTFVWSGNTIAEERDSTGSTVTKRFFAEGEQRIGGSDAGNYYYTRDHLGSIREVTDSNGALQAQYDYDAWGNSVVVSGNMSVDFGYTGHYFHQPSGLNLTLYRAYSPTLGRWLSRDPLENAEMRQGTNLYSYVGNNSVNLTDPLGLLWYEDLATWAQTTADRTETWLDFHLPWQIAGVGDTAVALLAGVASTPDAISHLGEGTGAWSEDPSWETSPGLFMDISLSAGILAGGLSPTEIGNSSICWKGGEITFTRPAVATPDLRINPFGDWNSSNPNAQWPHYHRRPGIGTHRPWEGW
jgi:RHS repeat-associated protein